MHISMEASRDEMDAYRETVVDGVLTMNPYHY